MAVGANVQELVKRAHLVDGDLLAGLFLAGFATVLDVGDIAVGQRTWLQQAQVRVIALRQPTAGKTKATGAAGVAWLFAEQRCGKGARQIEFPDAGLAHHKQRMWQLGTPGTELLPSLGMKLTYVHKQFVTSVS